MSEFNHMLQMALEDAYKGYPRKLGKSPGMKFARANIRTLEKAEQLKNAIWNYRKHLEREKTESKFIMHFSTFMRQWSDWLDENHGATDSFDDKRSILEILGGNNGDEGTS
jgi:hypothetical protein